MAPKQPFNQIQRTRYAQQTIAQNMVYQHHYKPTTSPSTQHFQEPEVQHGINIIMIIHNRLERICSNLLIMNKSSECLRLTEITFHPSFWRIECSNMIIRKLCIRSSMSPKPVELKLLLAPNCKNKYSQNHQNWYLLAHNK